MKFPSKTGDPVMYRTYLRKIGTKLETPEEAIARSLQGSDGANLTPEEKQLCLEYGLKLYSLPSGRRLWYGGTPDSEKPENVGGLYNCNALDPSALGLDVFREGFHNLMLGCGVGTNFEKSAIASLPPVNQLLKVEIVKNIPSSTCWDRNLAQQETTIKKLSIGRRMIVGDSRAGWIEGYMTLIEIATGAKVSDSPLFIEIDLSNVRPPGTPIRGFGGKANPQTLPDLFHRTAKILNGAIGRQLNSLECCLLIDVAAHTTVSGNVRRAAEIHQGSHDDAIFGNAKAGLWQQDENGNWRIDPERDVLRMANHTRVFHRKPTEQECIESVQQQFYSGEGAIQYAPEAIARANADIFDTPISKSRFLKDYERQGKSGMFNWMRSRFPKMSEKEINHRLNRYGLNPCGEILGSNFFCNLAEVHLNQLALQSDSVIEEAFRVAALNACRQLVHQFQHPELQYSRELDPIIGVSFTGLFDFFVLKFGMDYLRWWKKERCSILITNNPTTQYNLAEFFRDQERSWLLKFKLWTQKYVWDYCDRHGLKRPNRFTTVQPSGTKSLLTGASPGWHPPKATRYIRRITFRKNDPVALACIDCGYNVVPSQSDTDENGNLLNDPFDPRCTEWLVEIPCEVPWAAIADEIDFDSGQISALAQFDFAMQVQRHYTGHNTSATIELRETEIEPLGKRIHQAIANEEGYVSFALLARFDDHQSFPRLPFEPISKTQYIELVAAIKNINFGDRVNFHLENQPFDYEGPAGCDSDKCLISC